METAPHLSPHVIPDFLSISLRFSLTSPPMAPALQHGGNGQQPPAALPFCGFRVDEALHRAGAVCRRGSGGAWPRPLTSGCGATASWECVASVGAATPSKSWSVWSARSRPFPTGCGLLGVHPWRSCLKQS
jgi:hypothetical protein